MIPRRKQTMTKTQQADLDQILAEDLTRFTDLRKRLGDLPTTIASLQKRSKRRSTRTERPLFPEISCYCAPGC
ncbi:MAG: hypothetical protein Ct9H300mP1_06360 [Planctomycetaceae bacterium]|nr:MAG: hypothetical protein Ct9H300mP1_06360 [Planctomycetaceae bacterium]